MAAWIPVVVAVVSALLAGWFAFRTKRWELRTQRQLEIERRTAAPKAQSYEPLLSAIHEMLEQTSRNGVTKEWVEQNLMSPFRDYMKWVTVYGSDDAVWVAHRFMQATYADAPHPVTMRLLAELLLSIRRELGNPETKVTALDIMGFRIKDIYEAGVGAEWATQTEPQLYNTTGWNPPWGKRFRFGRPLRP